MIFAISPGIMLLAACQVKNVRDTGGGYVSPSSTVTGVSMGSGEPVPVFPASTTCELRSNL
ncbi:TPA: colicin s4 lysis protein [Escherichia coli]|nr:colicin release lysis protein [Escherichia coli]EJD7275371.1 colicin release lysis protein [Escherichia coli]HAH2030729.1 colicin s4 lysis protein [Escherichia coli]